MSLVFLSSSIVPSSCFKQNKVFNLKSYQSASLTPYLPFVSGKNPLCITQNFHAIFRKEACGIPRSSAIDCTKPNYQSSSEEDMESWDLGDQEKEDIEDADSPWEGAVIYKRNSSISHVEYCTTLERLGLGKLSTEVSKTRASIMGLRVTKAVKDYPFGTPVQTSVDITRKKQKLRLDGIMKTVITLGCNRCGEPAAVPIFSDFSLLLTEEPIEEPDIINMGTIYGQDETNTYSGVGAGEDDDDAEIDFEDRFYFPPEEKEIDISKHIRDLVHLEITINAVCDPNCKGMCLKCGANLNTSSCNCSNQEVERDPYGPLGNLRKQMQPN
ncbi:hypothetical protein UlMin_025909 [Ulmus minor]